MRRLVRAIGTALSLSTALAACGAAEQAARSGRAPASTPSARVHRAVAGEVITLTGDDDAGGRGRLRMAVRVRQVLQKAVGRDVYARPRKGERFVAVRFVLKNVGEAAYHDSPTYGAKVVDSTGRSYDATVAAVSAGAGFGKILRLGRGQERSGFIVFAVPKRARVTAVRYTLDSAAVGEVGEWRTATRGG